MAWLDGVVLLTTIVSPDIGPAVPRIGDILTVPPVVGLLDAVSRAVDELGNARGDLRRVRGALVVVEAQRGEVLVDMDVGVGVAGLLPSLHRGLVREDVDAGVVTVHREVETGLAPASCG